MFHSKTLFGLIIMMGVLCFASSCSKDNSTKNSTQLAQWRGDNRDGIYHETGLLDEWPDSGPEKLWIYEGIGKGFAAPSILNNRIFVNGEIDSTSYLFAFTMDGKLLWKSPNGPEFMGEGFSATYPGSRSTPTVVNDLVYATSGSGRIACFEAASGEEQWAVNIADLGGPDKYFGYSESPIVDKDKVYCFPGGISNNNVALDRFTGEIVWSNKAVQDTFSYCSPVIAKLPEKEFIVTHSRHHMYAYDPEKALEYYREVETLDEENLNTQLNIGHCLLELGRFEEALKTYFKVEYLAPGNKKVWKPIGWCSFVTGKLGQAEKYFAKLIDNEPNKHDLMNMGHVQWSLGRRKEALDYYKKSILQTEFTETEFFEVFEDDLNYLLEQGVEKEDVPIMLDQLRYFVEE